MNCPQCSTPMVLTRATTHGADYHYCRGCKKEAGEMPAKIEVLHIWTGAININDKFIISSMCGVSVGDRVRKVTMGGTSTYLVCNVYPYISVKDEQSNYLYVIMPRDFILEFERIKP